MEIVNLISDRLQFTRIWKTTYLHTDLLTQEEIFF